MLQKYPIVWRILRIAIPLLLSVCWLGFIFGNSLKDGVASSEQSGKVHEIINEVASSVGVKEPISEATVRNMAHFTEFTILGAILCLDLWGIGLVHLRAKRRFDVLWLLVAIPASFLFACLDEYLQNFSEGRVGDFADVLTDTEGALLGTLLFLGLFLLLRVTFHPKKRNP